MITADQIRSARAALRWTSERLANEAGLALRTIKNLEQGEGVPASRSSSIMAIKNALETAGIEFIGTPDDGPGIRLRREKAR